MLEKLIAVLLMAAPARAASCESLASLSLAGTSITLSQAVAAGPFTPRAMGVPMQVPKSLPAYCRVAATIAPVEDSEIKIEVWMPVSGWNGKFQAVGNGGWSGSIPTPRMAGALALGFATAGTDTGHTGGSGRFALGHPEKLIDFGSRAVHEMTLKAKAIIDAYYGSAPKFSYWNGCSSGGKEGLKEAQRFPDDYNGIIAGDPANDWTHQMAWELWVAQAVHKNDASYIPPAKYKLIHDAALAACDALDGVKDGVLEDPTRCHFDPGILQCKGGDAPVCLTAAQVEAARMIYSPAKNPRTGRETYPGLQPGSELGWATLAGPQPFMVPVDHFKYVVFKDTNWDWHTLNFDGDVALADKLDNGTINATDPNLTPFVEHGGKLIIYHGWSDPVIAPGSSVNYFNSVVAAMGDPDRAAKSVRLFMVPGMGHCGGGQGTGDFDMMSAIEPWVEKGQTPDRIVASRTANGVTDRTRPLCPYPQVARYKGSGSINEATSFACQAPNSGQ